MANGYLAARQPRRVLPQQLALRPTPVAAQQRNSFTAQQRLGTVPPRPPHALNRSMSLSAPATSPLQQQMQNNYATQLMGAASAAKLTNMAGNSKFFIERLWRPHARAFSPTITRLLPVATSKSEKLAKLLILIREIRTSTPDG